MPGRRIAQKIFLGYSLPLAVLLVAGVLIPLGLSAWLGRINRDYEATVRFVDVAYDLRRAALDSENHLRGYSLYRTPAYRRRFFDSTGMYEARRREIAGFARARRIPFLEQELELTDAAYRRWLRETALPLTRGNGEGSGRQGDVGATGRQRDPFARVRIRLNALVDAGQNYRDGILLRARAADSFLRITMLAVPPLALVLALLIGRSIAVGITRPLETLTRATEEMEKGKASAAVPLLENELSDDELGELQRAFLHMARTISNREAILRAQNEAVGALHRRIEAVLNATNDGIVMLDKGGGFSLINRRFGELFGVEPEVLQDHMFEQAGPLLLSRFKQRVVVRQWFFDVLRDPDHVTETTFDITEPMPRTLRIYSAPVHGELSTAVPLAGDAAAEPPRELLGRIFVFRDVTRETIADRMKTEFVSTVSHELRTPLTAIKGYVDLIVGGKTGPLTEVQREFLSMVQSSTRRLTALINDMLDISRIEAGRMEVRYESVEYLPIVHDTVRMMAREAEAKNISLKVEVSSGGGVSSDGENVPLPPVIGDADRITQVLVNLISNAVKYTAPGGSIRILIEPEESVVTTCVADTGIGISRSDMDRLFQKFFRADNSTTREVGGTGLGLAITKAILEKMHGSIRVDSAPGQGSRFYFTLPVVAPEGAVIAPAPPITPVPASAGTATAAPEGGTEESIGVSGGNGNRAAPARRGMVLSIEDNGAVLHLISHHLRRQGLISVGARTGAEALALAPELRPDIITLNVALGSSGSVDSVSDTEAARTAAAAAAGAATLPHLHGLEVLRRLRAHPATCNVPVLLLSVQKDKVGDGALVQGNIAFFDRAMEEQAFRKLVEDAAAAARERDIVLPPAIVAADAAAAAPSGPPPLILAVGSESLTQRLREHRESGAAETQVREESSLRDAVSDLARLGIRPHVVIVDVEDREIGEVGRLLAVLRRRPETAMVPVLIATEAAVCDGSVRPLVPLGAEPIPIEQLGDEVGKLLRRVEPETRVVS